MTPLGLPVDPEVYMMTAMLLAVGGVNGAGERTPNSTTSWNE